MAYFWKNEIFGFSHETKSGRDLQWETNEYARFVVDHDKRVCCFTWVNSTYLGEQYAYPTRYVEHLPKLYQDQKGVFNAHFSIIEGSTSALSTVRDLRRKSVKFSLKIVEPTSNTTYHVVGINDKATATTVRNAFGRNYDQVLNVSPFRPDSRNREREVFEVLGCTQYGFERIRNALEQFNANCNNPKLHVVRFETPIGLSPIEKLYLVLISKSFLPRKKGQYQKLIETIMIVRRELKLSVAQMVMLRDKCFARNVSFELLRRGEEIGPKRLLNIGYSVEKVTHLIPELVSMQSSALVVT